MRGRSCVPDEPRRWRPKTRTAALAALAVARRYAARLAAIAREQEIRERALRDELEKLKASTAAQAKELTETQNRLTKTEQQRNEKTKESFKRKRQTERLIDRLKRTEREVSRKEKALEQARADLAALRQQHEQQGGQLADAKTELAEMSRRREDLASTDSQAQVELLQRRLEAEQARRTEAEEHIDALRKEREGAVQSLHPVHPVNELSSSLGHYRDFARLMSYDPFIDPLFQLMRDEVLLSARYSDWQERYMQRVTARRRDPTQTLEEQAFAAVMALRWRLIDHPHIRQSTVTTWVQLGVRMHARDERYATQMINERRDDMCAKMML